MEAAIFEDLLSLLRRSFPSLDEYQQARLLAETCRGLGVHALTRQVSADCCISVNVNDNWGLRKMYLHFQEGTISPKSKMSGDWLDVQLGQVWSLASILRQMDRPVLWDVGANYGLYSLLLAPFADQVIAVEPAEATCELLRRSARMSGRGNIRVVRCAAFSEDREGALYLSPFHHGDHRVYDAPVGYNEDILGPGTSKRSLEEVPFRKLDTLAREYLKRLPTETLVKLDVQGAEIEVVRGMAELVDAAKTFCLMMECGPEETADAGVRQEDVLTQLDAIGLRLHHEGTLLNPYRAADLIAREFSQDRVTRDYLFVKN